MTTLLLTPQQMREAAALMSNVVKIPRHVEGPARREMILWLEQHMGPRFERWCHPRAGEYTFRNSEDAMEFTLTWL